jgi:hypothetical protein
MAKDGTDFRSSSKLVRLAHKARSTIFQRFLGYDLRPKEPRHHGTSVAHAFCVVGKMLETIICICDGHFALHLAKLTF